METPKRKIVVRSLDGAQSIKRASLLLNLVGRAGDSGVRLAVVY
jgi:hypothetical protein